MPAPAQAADVQVRVLVDVADLVFRSGRPYYYDEGYYRINRDLCGMALA